MWKSEGGRITPLLCLQAQTAVKQLEIKTRWGPPRAAPEENSPAHRAAGWAPPTLASWFFKEKKTRGTKDGQEKGKTNQLDATATANTVVRARGGKGQE